MNRRNFTSLAVACLAPAFAWLAGFDFNERGLTALATALGSLCLWVFAWTCPGWEEK